MRLPRLHVSATSQNPPDSHRQWRRRQRSESGQGQEKDAPHVWNEARQENEGHGRNEGWRYEGNESDVRRAALGWRTAAVTHLAVVRLARLQSRRNRRSISGWHAVLESRTPIRIVAGIDQVWQFSEPTGQKVLESAVCISRILGPLSQIQINVCPAGEERRS